MTGGDSVFLCYLDRRRDLLAVYADPRPLHTELDLHLLSIGAVHDPATMGFLYDGLSAMGLYLVSRPRFESHGWTISLQDPVLNLFFAGSARDATIACRAFLENVQPAPTNRFYAQTARPRGAPQTSSVEVEGSDIFAIVEQYCDRSDQQPVRLFRLDGGRVALLAMLPNADREWFLAAGPDEVFALETSGDLKLIAERPVTFRCGCDTGRIVRIVADLYRDEPEDLFRGESSVEAECPRCGARHAIERGAFDRALAGPEPGAEAEQS